MRKKIKVTLAIILGWIFLILFLLMPCYAEIYPMPELFEKYPNEWEIIYSNYPYQIGNIITSKLANALATVGYFDIEYGDITAPMLNYCCKKYKMWKIK